MIFNPDLSKQTQETIFSRKTNKISHPTTTFNTVPVCSYVMSKTSWFVSWWTNQDVLLNILIWKFQKQIRELESSKGFHLFYKENTLQLFTNFSWDHILITVTLFMTNQTIKVFVPKLNEYSTMLPLQRNFSN